MSSEITCAFFHAGEETDVPRADALAPFKAFVDTTEEISTLLKFPDGGEADLDIDDAMHISDFILDEPPASPEFWAGLFQILQTMPGAVFSDHGGLAVAQASMVSEIGEDMVEEFGTPKVVTSADALRTLFLTDGEEDEEED
ncbi:MAG TPA: hypothetical protein VGG48_10155 [Rhizomicrobium sp.]|jgi:hypothetical protein